mmetsp:Transcript_36840/g.113506  ORF Transcript_36840/g.113506 Transcript_36840/m.113506 type:complete len:211 (-) Transcript_36840:412-1044(-)
MRRRPGLALQGDEAVDGGDVGAHLRVVRCKLPNSREHVQHAFQRRLEAVLRDDAGLHAHHQLLVLAEQFCGLSGMAKLALAQLRLEAGRAELVVQLLLQGQGPFSLEGDGDVLHVEFDGRAPEGQLVHGSLLLLQLLPRLLPAPQELLLLQVLLPVLLLLLLLPNVLMQRRYPRPHFPQRRRGRRRDRQAVDGLDVAVHLRIVLEGSGGP